MGRIFRLAAALAAATAVSGLTADETNKGGLEWEVLRNCRIEAVSEGTAFHITSGGRRHAFRLYFVDPLTDAGGSTGLTQDRLRYFQIPAESMNAIHKRTETAARSFLKEGFEVVTAWREAGGGQAEPVHLALVRKEADYLSIHLAKKGLARTHGIPPTGTWPGGPSPESFLAALKQAERRSQQDRAGIWRLADDSPQTQGMSLLKVE